MKNLLTLKITTILVSLWYVNLINAQAFSVRFDNENRKADGLIWEDVLEMS